jgi:hypothetical protein
MALLCQKRERKKNTREGTRNGKRERNSKETWLELVQVLLIGL